MTRILIADPDADTRCVYRDVLAHAGYEVIEATDGRDALAKVFGYSPSLLITKLALPFVRGDALCDILRRDRLTAAVPILVVTKEAPISPEAIVSEAQRLLSMPPELRAQRNDPGISHVPADETLAKQPRRTARKKAHLRFTTTSPPKAPPTLTCPSCDRVLKYEQSHVGGVNERHPEQWDYFVCPGGCGVFQYRQRTRRVRRADT